MGKRNFGQPAGAQLFVGRGNLEIPGKSALQTQAQIQIIPNSAILQAAAARVKSNRNDLCKPSGDPTDTFVYEKAQAKATSLRVVDIDKQYPHTVVDNKTTCRMMMYAPGDVPEGITLNDEAIWMLGYLPAYYNQIEDRWYEGGKDLNLKTYDQLSATIKAKVNEYWTFMDLRLAGSSIPGPIRGSESSDIDTLEGEAYEDYDRFVLKIDPEAKKRAKYTASGAIFMKDIPILVSFTNEQGEMVPVGGSSNVRLSSGGWGTEKSYNYVTELMLMGWYPDMGASKRNLSYTPNFMLRPWNQIGALLTYPDADSGVGRTSTIMQQSGFPYNEVNLNSHAQDIEFLDYWEALEKGIPFEYDAFEDYDYFYSKNYPSLSETSPGVQGSLIKAEWERIMDKGPYMGQPKWKYLQDKYAWRKQGKFRVQPFDYMCVYYPDETKNLLTATDKPDPLQVDVVVEYYKEEYKKIRQSEGKTVFRNIPKEYFYAILKAKLEHQKIKTEKALATSLFQEWYEQYVRYEQAGDYQAILEMQQQQIAPAPVDQEKVDELTQNIDTVEDERVARQLPWVTLGVSAAVLTTAYVYFGRGKK